MRNCNCRIKYFSGQSSLSVDNVGTEKREETARNNVGRMLRHQKCTHTHLQGKSQILRKKHCGALKSKEIWIKTWNEFLQKMLVTHMMKSGRHLGRESNNACTLLQNVPQPDGKTSAQYINPPNSTPAFICSVGVLFSLAYCSISDFCMDCHSFFRALLGSRWRESELREDGKVDEWERTRRTRSERGREGLRGK